MAHSIINDVSLSISDNRYGSTAARPSSADVLRPKTITVDCHAHVQVADAARHVAPYHDPASLPFGRFSTPETLALNKRQDSDREVALTDPKDRIKVLDALGIDIQIVSPAPPQCYYDVPAEIGIDSSRLVNTGVAAFVAAAPERFVGLGTVPLQDPEAAVAELEYVIRKLKFPGVQILTNVNGTELSSPVFEPFWAAADRLGAVVMLHPLGFTDGARFERHYFANTIGNPLDTTVALHHLIFDGVLERHPTLKLLAVHGGGYLPSYSGRMDHAWGARKDARGSLPYSPTTYLRRIYFDSVVFTHHQLRHLVDTYGADHVLLGTDYPYDMAEYQPVQHVMETDGLSDNDRAMVAGKSALRLFKINPKAR
ncbi:aminocarboxymuconate-semialdehyde decarboxylase [Nitrobacteraceae bacterium AZCC 2161]